MTPFNPDEETRPVNVVYVSPSLFLKLPPGQIQAACEEVERRLLHLNPVILLKKGENPGEIQTVVDDIFRVKGNA